VQKISFGSVRIFWLDYSFIIERLKRVADTCTEYQEIREVWLFGSVARFKAVPGSDIDLLLVISESDKRIIDRIEKYQDIFSDMGISVDIFPYTVHESDTSFVRNAKKTGICIYTASDEMTGRQGLSYLENAARQKRKHHL